MRHCIRRVFSQRSSGCGMCCQIDFACLLRIPKIASSRFAREDLVWEGFSFCSSGGVSPGAGWSEGASSAVEGARKRLFIPISHNRKQQQHVKLFMPISHNRKQQQHVKRVKRIGTSNSAQTSTTAIKRQKKQIPEVSIVTTNFQPHWRSRWPINFKIRRN